MANIRVIEAPKGLGLSPTETGIESMAAVGRRLGAFGSQIAETYNEDGRRVSGAISTVGQVATDYMTHRDISKGSAYGTQLASGLDDEWNTLIKGGKDRDGNVIPPADPNDPSVRQKFLQDRVEPAIEQFKEGFSTDKSQQWAEQFGQHLRTHLSTKSAADMSTLAGVAAVQNVAKTTNNLSSMVASDPSALDFALTQYRHSVGAAIESSPSIDATKAAEIRASLKGEQAIVKAAVSGMIQKNPNVDLDAIQKKYGDYIDGAEMKMFAKAAQTQAKVDFLQQKQIESYQRQQQERKANDEFSKVVTDNFSAAPDGKLAINPKAVSQTLDILKRYPEAGAAAARAMIDFVESQQNKGMKAIDDPDVIKDLSDRMFSVDKPTTTIDLMRARTKGQISDHTFTVMNGLVKEMQESPLKGPVYQDTMKAVHDALIVNVPGLPGRDTIGSAKYAQFVQNFIPQYLAKSRAGTLEPNALDVNDPNSMIAKAMEPFKRTPQQRMQDYMSGLEGLGASKAAAKEPPRITSKAEYDKLDKGTVYISAKDGQRYEKQ